MNFSVLATTHFLSKKRNFTTTNFFSLGDNLQGILLFFSFCDNLLGIYYHCFQFWRQFSKFQLYIFSFGDDLLKKYVSKIQLHFLWLRKKRAICMQDSIYIQNKKIFIIEEVIVLAKENKYTTFHSLIFIFEFYHLRILTENVSI